MGTLLLIFQSQKNLPDLSVSFRGFPVFSSGFCNIPNVSNCLKRVIPKRSRAKGGLLRKNYSFQTSNIPPNTQEKKYSQTTMPCQPSAIQFLSSVSIILSFPLWVVWPPEEKWIFLFGRILSAYLSFRQLLSHLPISPSSEKFHLFPSRLFICQPADLDLPFLLKLLFSLSETVPLAPLNFSSKL